MHRTATSRRTVCRPVRQAEAAAKAAASKRKQTVIDSSSEAEEKEEPDEEEGEDAEEEGEEADSAEAEAARWGSAAGQMEEGVWTVQRFIAQEEASVAARVTSILSTGPAGRLTSRHGSRYPTF